MEVFSRIRLVARENYLDSRAQKILNNYGRLFKQKCLFRAFSKWRVNNYTYLVNKMNQKREELVRIQDKQQNETQNMEA